MACQQSPLSCSLQSTCYRVASVAGLPRKCLKELESVLAQHHMFTVLLLFQLAENGTLRCALSLLDARLRVTLCCFSLLESPLHVTLTRFPSLTLIASRHCQAQVAGDMAAADWRKSHQAADFVSRDCCQDALVPADLRGRAGEPGASRTTRAGSVSCSHPYASLTRSCLFHRQDELNVEQLFCATIVSFKRLMESLAFDDAAAAGAPLSTSRDSNTFDEQTCVLIF